jgi:hypothetical protein
MEGLWFRPFFLWKQVIWVVTICGWEIYSRRFEEGCRLHPQGYERIHVIITMKSKKVCS